MADELDRVIEKLKDVSEETKKMSDSFSGLTDMTDVSSDSLNSMKVMLKEFKDSISTNSTAMGISTTQTKLFNQQSTNAASLLNALSGEIKAIKSKKNKENARTNYKKQEKAIKRNKNK